MIEQTPPALAYRRAVQLWLFAVAALIFAMVVVGGATRLTESGLSITEWKPVTGALPPLSAQEWQDAFAQYRAIPQYRALNSGMDLAAFKTIFWWEWSHRLLGRAIGFAFLLPFLWFLWRGAIGRGLGARLWAIFALGALQGAVGWWMVASGLSNRTEVSEYRLAFHLTLAGIIYAAIVWTALDLGRARRTEAAARSRVVARLLLVMVLAQIYLGALVAGLRAGLVYNTWPTIDGAMVPRIADLFAASPWWRNFFENALTVQFDHRMLAYAIWITAVVHALAAARNSGRFAVGAGVLALAVTLQAGLGILTLLHQVPLGLALAHQAGAMLTLTVAVAHAAGMPSPAAATSSGLASAA